MSQPGPLCFPYIKQDSRDLFVRPLSKDMLPRVGKQPGLYMVCGVCLYPENVWIRGLAADTG